MKQEIIEHLMVLERPVKVGKTLFMIKSHSETRKSQGLTERLFISSLEVGDKRGAKCENMRRHTSYKALCTPLFPQKQRMLCKNYSCQQNKKLKTKSNYGPYTNSLWLLPHRPTAEFSTRSRKPGKKITRTQNFDPDRKEYIVTQEAPPFLDLHV